MRDVILALGRRYDFEEGHSLQDERLALRLFDERRGWGCTAWPPPWPLPLATGEGWGEGVLLATSSPTPRSSTTSATWRATISITRPPSASSRPSLSPASRLMIRRWSPTSPAIIAAARLTRQNIPPLLRSPSPTGSWWSSSAPSSASLMGWIAATRRGAGPPLRAGREPADRHAAARRRRRGGARGRREEGALVRGGVWGESGPFLICYLHPMGEIGY